MAAVINIGDWVIASSQKVWTPEELASAQDAVGLLESAAERGREIIAQAEREGEQIRANAQAEGYRTGEVQALRRVLGRMGGQEALIEAVRSFVTEAVSVCAADMIFSDLDPARYSRLLETVDQTLAGWTWVTLRVAPESLDEAAEVVASLQGNIADKVSLVPDESLQIGECLIESDAGWLDGRLETKLAQVRAALDEILGANENGNIES